MGRLACINIPHLPLQIIMRRHRPWRELPAAVVTEEKPLGRVTSPNKLARAAGVRPGMRYASALGICPQLRVEPVSEESITMTADQVVQALHHFTPQVEASRADAALFWANAAGMKRLYSTPAKWAGSIETALTRLDLISSVVVGFSRFGSYAAAKRRTGVTVLPDQSSEHALAMRAPLHVLPIDHDVLERLSQLGIRTIREFARFSPGALRRRFGREVEALQRFARGEAKLPLQSIPEAEPLRREKRLSYAERTSDGIVHHLSGLLGELFATAAECTNLVAEIEVELTLEDGRDLRQSLRSARSTNNIKLYEKLLRLRIEALALELPVVAVAASARLVGAVREQTDLFRAAPRRDPEKARKSIALIQAELGNEAVRIAELADSHLPEEQFRWCAADALRSPQPPGPSGDGPEPAALVRRILKQPIAGAAPQSDATVSTVHRISGGWWQAPVEREYRYVRTRAGRLLWGYVDPSGEWLVQGAAE